MGTSWYEKVKEFKSPLHVIAAFLVRSRATQLAKVCQLNEQVDQLESRLEQQQQQLRQKQEQIETLRQRASKAEKQRDPAQQSVNLPEDPPIGTHGYGASMISLSVNLARSVGFRGAVRTLEVFFRWLGSDRALPCRTSLRNWFQRLGIDEMNQPLDSSESLVMIVDHSNQIGPEKVVLALGVIGDQLEHATSKDLAQRLVDFLAESEELLREGERLPMSTEILESSFGLYKQLERQHSQSDFTSLLASLPALLKPITAERVTAAFNRVFRWCVRQFCS